MGMGRSGHFFACQKEGVRPDLLCLAKGLTCGYLPLAATLSSEEIFSAFLGPPEEGRTFFHGHTYTGNALGAAAALATLDIFEKESVVERMPQRISSLTEKLGRLEELSTVFDIRQFGFCAGIELRRTNGEPFDGSARIGMQVCTAARECGVFLRPLGDVIVLMPALSFSDQELDRLIEAVAHGISSVLGGQ